MLRRTVLVIAVVGLAIVLAVLAWPQALGVQQTPGIAQLVSLRGAAGLAAAAVAVLLLIVALAWRRARRALAAVIALLIVFAVVQGGILVQRGIATDQAQGSTDDGSLTVLAWNTLGDAPGAEAIAALALETGADVVSLPETTEATAIEVATIMRQAGRPMWVNTVAFDEFLSARSTSLLTSAELGRYRLDDSHGNTAVVPSVVAVPVDGDGPTIIAAHPVAPIPGYLDEWSADLDWLAGVCTGQNVVMAGDLNSTLDHYAGLGAASDGVGDLGDCVDAAATTGAAGVGTWPSSAPTLLGAPIDHVMSTPDRRAVATRVVDDRDGTGSDHRPIVATLVPVG